MTPGKRSFDLLNTFDVVQARQCAREIAREMGFGLADQTRIATAVSEVARRALGSPSKGAFSLTTVVVGIQRGLECICLLGEGIEDLARPARGEILGGVERLMDEFEVEPREGQMVAVVMRKWLRQV